MYVIQKIKEVAGMRIETIAENRKDIVNAISEMTETKSKYLGPPTFAYQIGAFVVERDGTVEIANEEDGAKILQGLVEQGFVRRGQGVNTVEVNVPIDGMDGDKLANLVFLIHSKQYLMNRSFGTEIFKISKELIQELDGAKLEYERFHSFFHQYREGCKGIAFAEGNVVFTFPPEAKQEKLRAFTELVAMMVRHAKEKKRINHKETVEENEKYYMRTWLIRLGLDGAGGKETRKAILADLKGHSAFRTKEEEERAKVRNKERLAEKQRREQDIAEAQAGALLIEEVNQELGG